MTYTAQLSKNTVLIQCQNCSEYIEPEAKFCGGCGCVTGEAPKPPDFVSMALNEYATRFQSPEDKPSELPGFAFAGIPVENERTMKLIVEANKLTLLLARERLFLYMHWIIFFVVNIFGFWLAFRCYNEFIGDGMSKLMIASTPFLFINSMSLLGLVPIKGTRNQIVHLKERIQYLRFNIEFGHLNF